MTIMNRPVSRQTPLACALVLAASLLGCARYEPLPLSAEAGATALEGRTLDDARLEKFVAIGLADDIPTRQPGQWDLPALTLAAIYYHPDIDIARARLAAARAGVTTAAQRPNPTLGFQDLSYNTTNTSPSPWTIAPTINFVIETFDKRAYRTAEAEQLSEAARRDLEIASWAVRGGVRTALLDLWTARRRLELLHSRLDLQTQLVGFLERRQSQGDASALDVSRERLARDQLDLAIRDGEQQQAAAIARLAAAIGIPARSLESADISVAAFDPPTPAPDLRDAATLRREALLGRSDVLGMLAEYEAAESALQLQIARQYPDVTLSPGYGYNAGANMWLLLPLAELPIFHQNQGPIAQARARREEVAARFNALQARIIGDIDQATANYAAATRSVAAADRLLAEESARADRVVRAQQMGEIDRTAVLTSEIERAATRLSRLDALVRQRQALGALEDALQRPLFDPQGRIFAPETSPRSVAG